MEIKYRFKMTICYLFILIQGNVIGLVNMNKITDTRTANDHNIVKRQLPITTSATTASTVTGTQTTATQSGTTASATSISNNSSTATTNFATTNFTTTSSNTTTTTTRAPARPIPSNQYYESYDINENLEYLYPA